MPHRRMNRNKLTFRLYHGPVNVRNRRNPVVAARSGEGLFTIPFADLHQCKTVEFTTYALAEASTCLSLCSRGWRIDRDRYQVARAW